MTSAELLTAYECCPRKGYYSQAFRPGSISLKELTYDGLKAGLLAPGGSNEKSSWGDIAGSEILQLAEDHEIETDSRHLYDSVLHHANLADILVTAIRKPDDPPWLVPENTPEWTSGCFLSPDRKQLRRIVFVSHWNDQRHYSECRSWFTVGEMAQYKIGMQLIVLVIGQERDGKRHTPWTSGFLHPMNKVLRFRKRSRASSEVFNDRWAKVFREDHDEISRETWLQGMLKDDVLPQVCFRVDVPALPETQVIRVRDLAKRKLESIQGLTEKPLANLSTCDWPVPCPYRKCCHSIPEKDPESVGFHAIR